MSQIFSQGVHSGGKVEKLNIECAEAVFRELATRAELRDLFGGVTSWGIVGGAVRDALLSKQTNQRWFWPRWPDLDIAVFDENFEEKTLFRKMTSTPGMCQRNNFGGWKLVYEGLGVIDVWMVERQQCFEDISEAWLSYLRRFDYGVNMVAFVWPVLSIVTRPEWFDDVKRGVVENHFCGSARKELQPLRGVALAAKLSSMCERKFVLGRNALREFAWFANKGEPALIRVAFNYVNNKVATGRWAVEVLEYLERVGSKVEGSQVFQRELSNTLKPLKEAKKTRSLGKKNGAFLQREFDFDG